MVDQLASALKPGERTRFQAWTHRVAVIAPGQTDYRGSPDIQRRLARLLEAMRDLRAVRLTYLSPARAHAGGRPRKLLVHPLGIVHYRHGLYFIVDIEEGDLEKDRGRRILLSLERMDDVAIEASKNLTHSNLRKTRVSLVQKEDASVIDEDDPPSHFPR